MIALAILAVLFSAAGVLIAFDLRRVKRKEPAPQAAIWNGPMGFTEASWKLARKAFPLFEIEAEILWESMEAFLAKKIDPLVIVFVDGKIRIDEMHWAAGVYHPSSLWTEPWMEVSIGWEGWRPSTLEMTAFCHELLHHGRGLGDGPRFFELFRQYVDDHNDRSKTQKGDSK